MLPQDSAAVKTTPETEIGERKPGDKKPTKKPPPAPKKDFSHLKPKGKNNLFKFRPQLSSATAH